MSALTCPAGADRARRAHLHPSRVPHIFGIGHNLPLERIAGYFARLGRRLIIDLVPKSDSQVQRMLRSRPDILPGYTRDGFEAAFRTCFRIDDVQPVLGSERLLYSMTAADQK